MAVVAQLVEFLIVVQDVAGSSPVDRPSFGWVFGTKTKPNHSCDLIILNFSFQP
jgi:hypothetical protein